MARVRGGLMRVVETLAEIQGRDHEVLVLSPVEPRLATATSRVTWVTCAIKGNLDLSGHRKAVAAIDGFAPDVALLHAGSPGELAMAAVVAKRRAATVIVEHAAQYFPLGSPFRNIVLSHLKGWADRWVAVSGASARALEAAWRLAPGTIGVAYNGVDAPSAHPPPQEVAALFSGASVVLGLGSANATKGFDTFSAVAVALAPSLPDVRFVWVGAERPEPRDSVTLLPWSESVGWMLTHATIVAMPSRTEGLPLVLLEAWAAGRPVVASAVGGVPEVARDGVDALLVRPGDAAAWVSTVAQLLSDPDARRRLGRTGHQTWQSSFTAEAMAARYNAIIESVLALRSGGLRPRVERWAGR